MRIPFLKGKDVLFEPASHGQADMIARLHAKCFDRDWGEAEFAKLLTQENVICIVVKLVGRPNVAPLAFALARFAADEAEILSIGVDPVHRGKGLAGKLMDEMIRRLHAEQTSSVFLEVDSINIPAISLYRRLMFEEVAKRPSYYANEAGEKSAALVMRLDLV